ncbi:MAG TPA: invasion associated locus B family protein [Rhizomicrobium sp.]
MIRSLPISLARIAVAVLLAGSALSFTGAGAATDSPTLLGVSAAWSAFTSGSGSSRICYAISKPTATSPKAKRDPIYFLITDWPGRSPKTKSEPEVVPGYVYKDGSTVTVAVGTDKFEFFTQNNDGAGAAWIRAHVDEIKLVETMKRSQQLLVTGISKRGTTTRDTYSLAGLQDALDKIHASCGM